MEGIETKDPPDEGENIAVLDEHRPSWRRRVNEGNNLPGQKVTKQEAMRNPEIMHSLRERAAEIAVDMERGIHTAATGRQRKKLWKGPYSRWQIASDLGFNARSTSKLPKIFESPHFERYVEWERTKRDATFRAAMKDNLPLLDRTVSGMLLEAARRVLLQPEKIQDNVLFTELRKFMILKSEYEGAFNVPTDVQTVILEFQKNVKGLPEAARLVALNMFKQEILRLTSGANEAARVIEGEFKEAGIK